MYLVPLNSMNYFTWLYVFVLSCVCYVLCASVYMCFVVTCWERADLLALVCGVFCEFVTFPLVSWVRCGTWLYRFLIFATLLTFIFMFACRPFSFQYFHASNFTSNSSMYSAFITRLSLYNGQSVLIPVNRASYITIRSSGIRTEPWWTSTPKLLTATIANYCIAFHVLDHAFVAPTTRWFKSIHTSYLLSFSMLMKAI